MEIAKNEIRIDLRASDKLRAHFAALPDGEYFTLEIKAKKTSMTDDAVIGAIDHIAPKGFSNRDAESDEDENEVEPKPSEPLMVEVYSGSEE